MVRRGGKLRPSCCWPSRAALQSRPPGGRASWGPQAGMAGGRSSTGQRSHCRQLQLASPLRDFANSVVLCAGQACRYGDSGRSLWQS